MTKERSTPLRERMIEDMRIRGMGEKAQKAHIRAVKDFAKFLKRSPDTATSDELRAYQFHMTDTDVSPSTFNARIVALRFFFGMTCGREDMKRYMQFRTKPKKRPVVFSVEEVQDLLMAAPGPGLKYRAALSISYGAGLRAAEDCNLKLGDIDSDRMLIHVEQGKGRKDRKVMLSPSLLALLRDWWREARPEGWLFPGKPKINPISPRQLNRAFTSAKNMAGIKKRPTRNRNTSCAAPQLRNAPSGGEHRCAGDSGAARSRQADHDRAIHPCRHQDDPGHDQPVRHAGGPAGSDFAAKSGVMRRGVAPPRAGDR
jgi:site-specific recombinase XerD